MKSLENTIKYYELLMCYNDTSIFKNHALPKGYHYVYYKQGDEIDWVNIHISSGEFMSIKQGMEYFHEYYDTFLNELEKRCFFIVEDITNEKVGTATVSKLQKEEYNCEATVDWVAIRKEYQGKKLSRPLISKIIDVSSKLGHSRLLLKTQTITWLAVKLYLDEGFEPLNVENNKGWEIINTITNHSKLKYLKKLAHEAIYDKRNIAIERQLERIYNKDDFSYSVWYKDGLHIVYVYCKGISDEYEYFEEDGTVKLKKVTKKF